jgi:hypothetical protein
MIMLRIGRGPLRSAAPAVAALATVFMPALSAPAMAQQVTMETLLDRAQIEDLLTRYYYDLASGKAHDLSQYFIEDAVLDVDGTVAKGRAEIEALYAAGAPSKDKKDKPDKANTPTYPRGNMLLTNPVVEVSGDTAKAHVIWTGVMNNGVGKAPTLTEQGREDTELVKRDGKWLIKRRYISSDSGLPDRFDATWKPRWDPLEQ